MVIVLADTLKSARRDDGQDTWLAGQQTHPTILPFIHPFIQSIADYSVIHQRLLQNFLGAVAYNEKITAWVVEMIW
jgi:hypothetical protein